MKNNLFNEEDIFDFKVFIPHHVKGLDSTKNLLKDVKNIFNAFKKGEGKEILSDKDFEK